MAQALGVLVSVIALAACDSGRPVTSGTGSSTPPAVAPRPVAIDASLADPCERHARAACIEAKDCKLEHVSGDLYRCRASRGPCEVGLSQADKAGCHARAGCEWNRGDCYCSVYGTGRTTTVDEPGGAGACVCGGNPPPRCSERKKP